MAIDALSTTFSALADPTRRALLARLAAGEATVGELAAPHDMTLAAVSKHLKVLENAGLIARGQNAQWRPCRLRAEPLRAVSEWVGGYQRFWTGNLDSLGAYLAEIERGTPPAASPRKKRKGTAR
jgi:DNA-binding transcriptional ArsR family regulator